MSENITPRLRNVLKNAKKEAVKLKSGYIGVEHVTLAILETKAGQSAVVLKDTKIDFEKIREAISKAFAPAIASDKTDIVNHKDLDDCFAEAKKISDKFSHQFIGTEHMLVAILTNVDSVLCKTLKSVNVDTEAVRVSLLAELEAKSTAEPQKVMAGEASGDSKSETSSDPYLKRFASDLTQQAAEGKLDPVIGREKEVTRVIRILSRKKKNNPVLIGPPGVGKTSIAEGLAIRIHEKKVPAILHDKKVFALDFALIVAGTMYRGQFEDRLKKIIKEAKDNPSYIIFIDELHTVIGAGSAEGTMDASNMLKPALARGEFKCIGATTQEEYRKYIERDAALERRFQKVAVEEPNVADTITILKGAAKSYEKYHGVTYSAEVIEAAVTLSNRYVSGRYQPDKGFDVLDEAGASVNLSSSKKNEDKDKILKKIEDEKKALAEAKEEKNFERIAGHTTALEAWEFKLEKLKLAEKQEERAVKMEDIQSVISSWTGVPVGDLSSSDKKSLLKLNDVLNSVVVGQQDAIEIVTKALKKSKTPLKDPNRPIAGLLFCGPTGVGKTMLAKQIAAKEFGKENILELDMSEYVDGTAVNKLIGSPAGYVGYEDSAKLCKFVTQKPYSVILFDELEKAHQDVRQILLQILENGRLTDTVGKMIDFRNTIIIMTTNAGVEVAKSMGFGTQASKESQIKDNVLEELKRVFKPEFMNRVRPVLFKPLSVDNARLVVDLEIGVLNERMKETGVTIKCLPKAVDFILVNGFNEKFGARNVRSQVEALIEESLTDEFLRDKVPENSVITFDVVDTKLIHKIKGS